MADFLMVILLPELVDCAGSARSVGGFSLQARFVVERRVQDVSRSMRRECFCGKALNAAEQ